MAKLSFAVAVLALFAAASGAKTKSKVYRQTCVDANGQAKTEGQVWYEGVNGCLRVTCTNGVAVGTDGCTCTYPDGTTGRGGDVWYSIPTCQSCRCDLGLMACDTLLNCILPPTTTEVPAPSGTGTSCVGPENLQMNLGDMYIDGCSNCTCTASGLNCYGMAECPAVTTEDATNSGECFMGWLGFVDATVGDEFVENGYVFQEACNVCTCQDGVFVCEYTCVNGQDDTFTPEGSGNYEDDEAAALDCDVGEGIILNGDTWENECAATCVCVGGELQCPDCPGSLTESVIESVSVVTETVLPSVTIPSETIPVTEYVCVAPDGTSIENGGVYQSEKCTNCTCVNGVFTCVKVCERDCTTANGKVVSHGSSFLDTCSSCKCDDGTLSCTNTCEGKVCKVPNSTKTVAQGKTLKIDDCVRCKCTSTVLLQCRDYCETTTPCLCDRRMLRSGKSRTVNCQKCTCNGGKLSCKTVC